MAATGMIATASRSHSAEGHVNGLGCTLHSHSKYDHGSYRCNALVKFRCGIGLSRLLEIGIGSRATRYDFDSDFDTDTDTDTDTDHHESSA